MAAPAALTPPAGSGLRHVPGDAGRPVVGYTFEYVRDQLAWARSRYDSYGPVSWCRAFGTTMVNLVGADANEAVLVNRDSVFSQAGWHYFIGRFFGGGLMLLDFDEHLHHRRIMQQAFTRTRLRGYADRMAPVIADGIAAWQPGDRFLVYPALKKLTLDVATSVFVGATLGPAADRVNRAFVDTVRAGTAAVRAPVPGGRWWRGLRGRTLLEEHFAAMLPAKRTSDGDDLLAALCHAESEDGEVFSDSDVVNHIIFLLMAAHDTVTITLSTMMYQLARNPSWQRRAREESVAFGSAPPELGDVGAFATLDRVMRECLRLVSPVPSLPRRTTRDTDVFGYFVPEGALLTVAPGLTHRLEEYWPDSDRFDPARFSSDNHQNVAARWAYIPFGGGVHRCIGMHFAQIEVVLVMHQILQRFRWRVEPSYVMPLDTTALPTPADDLPVSLERIA